MSTRAPTRVTIGTATTVAGGDLQRLTGGGEGMVNMDSPLTTA